MKLGSRTNECNGDVSPTTRRNPHFFHIVSAVTSHSYAPASPSAPQRTTGPLYPPPVNSSVLRSNTLVNRGAGRGAGGRGQAGREGHRALTVCGERLLILLGRR
jgi:hypothetical protein